MDIISITADNIEREHICCALSDTKCGAKEKKEWLKARFADGLVFKRADVRGKCFIEYIPGGKAWAPIYADGYMYIDCFWVSGQLKGHGMANRLLDECIADSKAAGMKGVVALSSVKKESFLSDPGYLKHRGFTVADTAEPFFTLMYLPFTEGCEPPRFRECCKRSKPDDSGFKLYYTAQCPFTSQYVPVVENAARENGIALTVEKIDTLERAQNSLSPWTTYSLYHDGKYVTHEVLSDKRFLAIAKSFGK